jgi:hypothetical protein
VIPATEEFPSADSQDAESRETRSDTVSFLLLSFPFFHDAETSLFRGLQRLKTQKNFVRASPTKHTPIRGSWILRFGSFAAMT